MRGSDSQLQLQGTLHHNYLDEVNKNVSDERLQSIIVALDPFKLLYEYDTASGVSVNRLLVEKGQAVLLTSSLRHARGSNSMDNNTTWKYRLFAYIVLERENVSYTWL